MPVKRYFKKVARKGAVYAKKRYTTQTGGLRVKKLASDVYKIKRSLNVEHKHFDFKFGSGQPAGAQYPTNNTPIFLDLRLPSRGTAYNQRVGNQIRITHITSKLEILFRNNQDLTSRTTASVRLLWAKSGETTPLISDLYELDANGHYTRNSFVNTQSWNKFVWVKALNTFQSHQDQVNFSISPQPTPVSQSVNLSKYYVNKQTKTNIQVKFQNGSDTNIERMRPYLLFMSDTIEGPGAGPDYDPVSITGQIRFTYVDN